MIHSIAKNKSGIIPSFINRWRYIDDKQILLLILSFCYYYQTTGDNTMSQTQYRCYHITFTLYIFTNNELAICFRQQCEIRIWNMFLSFFSFIKIVYLKRVPLWWRIAHVKVASKQLTTHPETRILYIIYNALLPCCKRHLLSPDWMCW